MTRGIAAVACVVVLAACGSELPEITTGCGAAALCALQPTLVVTGAVRANAAALAGALVRVDAHQNNCGGTAVQLLPSPAQATTDAGGLYSIRVQPTQSAVVGCLHVSANGVFSDTTGVVLRVPPAAPETVRVNLTSP